MVTVLYIKIESPGMDFRPFSGSSFGATAIAIGGNLRDKSDD